MINEYNTIIKDPLNIPIRLASCYPNIYRTAISSLGYQLIYGLTNSREDTWCERVVYPNIRSIESNSPLKDFDIISFTLQYEEDYFNVIKMLKDGNIPVRKEDRNENHPLIIAGGPCASSNPLPLSDFIDIFVIGDAELVLIDILDLYGKIENPGDNIEKFLEINGTYPLKAELRCINNMGESVYTTKPIVVETNEKEFMPVFGQSIMLNISRGCSRGCRFCMSTYLYRPNKELELKKLFEIAESTRDNTGLNKVSLIGTSVTDYSKIEELLEGLHSRGFQISTPSLRIESINDRLLEILAKSGAKTITIAPESTYTLRKSLNKNITNEQIANVIEKACSYGLKLKLYFLFGIPNESEEDLAELCEYINSLSEFAISTFNSSNKNNSDKNNKNNDKDNDNTHNKKNNEHAQHIKTKDIIKFSFNPLIPKPNTPLQWESYDMKSIKDKIKYLKKNIKNKSIKFGSAKMGLVQYVLSCSGSEIGDLIEKTVIKGLNIKDWAKYKEGYDINTPLPWDNIDIGLNKSFLKEERNKFYNSTLRPWCGNKKNNCYNCGKC